MILNINDLLESNELYREAFTHKSLPKGKNFERLEFLGDSLVGAVITEALFQTYPRTSEGDLSRWKSTLVGQKTLAEISRALKLEDHLICKPSEKEQLKKNERIQASIFEALLGAYYLDKGHTELKTLIESLFKDRVVGAAESFKETDFKTLFQEEAQKYLSKTPVYKTLEKTGPAHKPHFKVAVCIEESIFATAHGESVKEAQMAAAQMAINILKKERTEQMEKI